MRLQFTFIISGIVSGMLLLGCNKPDSTLRIQLTDAPGDFQNVLVDIQEVWVKTDKENTGWLLLNTNKGVYDLLQFQNGVDTLLATGTLPHSTVKELRLVLGENNSVMKDSIVYPISIPSGSESGLKIKFEKALRADLEDMTIDFDANQSIVANSDKSFVLKPVIRVKN